MAGAKHKQIADDLREGSPSAPWRLAASRPPRPKLAAAHAHPGARSGSLSAARPTRTGGNQAGHGHVCRRARYPLIVAQRGGSAYLGDGDRARLSPTRKPYAATCRASWPKTQAPDRAQAIVQARDAGLGHQSRT